MERTLRRLLPLALLVVGAAALFAACGDDDDDGMHGDMSAMNQAPAGSIRVDLINWAVNPAQTSAKAGTVTFWAVHDMGHGHAGEKGGVTHDLQVMKKAADGSFGMAGQIQGLKMGEAKALTLSLEPGEYELACNLVEEIDGSVIPHYTKGMHTSFTVTA